MSKLEQNKAFKRSLIIRAAEEVFLSEGYQMANMDKVAQKAQMTKQTLYRYFPSKLQLFEALLQHLGQQEGTDFVDCLEEPDSHIALARFAKGFVRFHLTDTHLSVYRLLVAESQHSPEAVKTFFAVGSNQVELKLKAFFSERYPHLVEVDQTITLWTGMLLSLRSGALVGMEKPTQEECDRHAEAATRWMLSAIAQDRS